jgi:hypothetical protein
MCWCLGCLLFLYRGAQVHCQNLFCILDPVLGVALCICTEFPSLRLDRELHSSLFFSVVFPKDMALLALSMSQNSPWDRFLGERLRALAGTLGGAVILIYGVTTLGSCEESNELHLG